MQGNSSHKLEFILVFRAFEIYFPRMQLRFRHYGNAKEHLVILHGLLGSAKNWHSIAQQLARDRQIIVPTLRNHGDSPHGPHSIQHMRDDVLELLDNLQLEKTHLLGHSMGGMVGMDLAMQAAERLQSLIIVDTAPTSKLNRMANIFAALISLDLSSIKSRDDADKKLSLSLPDITLRQFLLQNLVRQQDNSYVWRCNLAELKRFVQNDRGFFLSAGDIFDKPTLFIGGGRSEYQLAEQVMLIESHFSNYKLEMIAEAGHWVHYDAPAAFLAAIDRWGYLNA